MRTEIEARLRCCWCRTDNFASWLVPRNEPSPSREALDYFVEQQVADFVCKACGGPRGVRVAVYVLTNEEMKRA